MVDFFTDLSEEQVSAYSLVLTSSGIPHRTHRFGNHYTIVVDEANWSVAEAAIRKYLEENEDQTHLLEETSPAHQDQIVSVAGLGGAVVLSVFYVFAVTQGSLTWNKAYGASASHILQGQWYRTITALMLHMDPAHLVGNIVAITLFSSAVCSTIGWGGGWLSIVAAGALGNFVNAWFYGRAHLSVGASTAVFGAIGILSTIQLLTRSIEAVDSKRRLWLPIAGGMALLAMLGASNSEGHSVDFLGHLFGFCAGLAVGACWYPILKNNRKISWSGQGACLTVTLGVISWAWLSAFDI